MAEGVPAAEGAGEPGHEGTEGAVPERNGDLAVGGEDPHGGGHQDHQQRPPDPYSAHASSVRRGPSAHIRPAGDPQSRAGVWVARARAIGIDAARVAVAQRSARSALVPALRAGATATRGTPVPAGPLPLPAARTTRLPGLLWLP